MSRTGRVLAAITIGVGLAGCEVEEVPGRQVFQHYCAGCHGKTGEGDGRMALGLPVPPADLSILQEVNDGVFPAEHVMASVYGYPGKHDYSVMPEFGPLLGGPKEMWVGADGKAVPTPTMLIELVSYIERLQR